MTERADRKSETQKAEWARQAREGLPREIAPDEPARISPPPPTSPSRTAGSSAPASLPRGKDRRVRPTPMLSRYTLFGRRRGNRRNDDPQSCYYVDRSSGAFHVAIVAMLVFIAADTASTLYIISQGGIEVNPLMRWLLQMGSSWFIAAKVASGFIGFLILAVHCKFPTARILGALLVTVYLVLAFYHVYLLTSMIV
ncbi:MAG: hypothetical protein KBD56_06445 [Candidatus Eisenbacteria bacterium]|nr:hypothetical protein [Candidatus Eisenbacteria bacterium]